MKLFVLIIYCILAPGIAYLQAQSYSSVHYDTKDGLPSATVYDITQDKNGFIWFGTENGLCRFDGKNFKTFTTKDGLPDNSILKVHGDKAGRVYFTPFTHSLHYYQNDSFFKVPIPDKYKVGLSIIETFVNKGDKVVLGAFGSAYIIENNHIISLHERFKEKRAGYIAVYDTLMIAVSGDSLYYIPDSGKVRIYKNLEPLIGRRIFNYRGQPQLLESEPEVNSGVGKYLADNFFYKYSGNLLYLFSTSTGKLIHKIKVDNSFSNTFIDNENNLWVSTLGKGVFRFPSFNFQNLNFDGKSEIFSLIKMDNRIIAGTDYSKMYSVPAKNVPPDCDTINLSRFAELSPNPIPRLTKRNRIYSLRSTGKSLYIGTDAFLLRQTGSQAPVYRNIFPVKDIDVLDGEILVCTGYGVLLLDEQNMSVKDTLLNQRSTCGIIYNGNYYIGTLGGLIKIDQAKKTLTELYALFPPFRSRIVSIKRGINNDLWIATSGSGLVHFKDNKIIETLTEEQHGLTSDICTSLFVDSAVIWLGTNKGLNKIQLGNEKAVVNTITSANGLGADFINATIATDSNVYVGTAEGLTIFSKNILTEKSVCMLHILQVSANNQKLKNENAYSFPYNTLNIQIDFTAISFKSAGDILYYYRLSGLDETWNTTTANFVNFPTLQPNNYTLYLKAVNKFGVESNTRAIRITILPPWWQTWSFRIIVLIAIGLLVLLIYRYNISNIKRKEETKREIETRFAALEQKAMQAQMNPHFIFNSLNSIQTFILNLDAEGANTYLTNFANLIRQTLENSMQPLITVASELKYIETYLALEKLRFRDKFEYEIHTDESIDQNNTLLPGMLLQPYIENAIRHGIQHRKDNNGLILLTISKAYNNSILYTIKDNGVGRKKAEELKSSRHIEYQSRGNSINEKRIAAINYQFKTNMQVTIEDIPDENGIVTGTSVTILIPYFHKQ